MENKIKKVCIAGGTGFIGYHAAKLMHEMKIEITSIALKESTIGLDTQFMHLEEVDLFELEEENIIQLLQKENYDGFVYALGPDDRIVPSFPAYSFFYNALVCQCKKICTAVKKAGIKKCVILNSYFSYFDRKMNGKLSKYHPYIQARVMQEEKLSELGDSTFSVMFLELPYIFGTIPNQTPLWKDYFLKPFDNYKSVMFPPNGGTAMIDVSGVAQAIVAALYYGSNGGRYPISSQNMTYKELIELMLKAKNDKRKFKNVPVLFAVLFGKKIDREYKKQNKESGLRYGKLMRQIQSKKFYIDAAISQKNLGFDKIGFDGGKDVKSSILETIQYCYKNES